MKEILKLWYFSVLFLRGQRATFFLLTPFLLITPPIIVSPAILSKDLVAIIVGYVIMILALVGACVVLWFEYIGSFFVIARFKKQFSFLPPATNEGRIAMQSKVDFELHQASKDFFLMCDEEKRLVSLLINKNGAPALNPDGIRATEIALDHNRKTVKNFKKRFWQKHAAAKSDLLPVAFEVYPSIHNYETNPPQKTVPKKHKSQQPNKIRIFSISGGNGKIV